MAELELLRRDGSVRFAAHIDEADFALVQSHRWFFDGRYAATKIEGRNVRLHRLLLDPAPGLDVDHIDGNTLNNRRSNLRAVPRGINTKNTPGRGGTSSHRGVSWDRSRGRWRAQAKFNYRPVFIGRFLTEAEAAAAVESFWLNVDPHSMSNSAQGSYFLDRALDKLEGGDSADD